MYVSFERERDRVKMASLNGFTRSGRFILTAVVASYHPSTAQRKETVILTSFTRGLAYIRKRFDQ